MDEIGLSLSREDRENLTELTVRKDGLQAHNAQEGLINVTQWMIDTIHSKPILDDDTKKEYLQSFKSIIASDFTEKKAKTLSFKGNDGEDKIDKILDGAHKFNEKYGHYTHDALELGKTAKPFKHFAKGEYEKGLVSGGIRAVDNTVLAPAKHSVIATGAGKGATIGAWFGPHGAAIGALVGGGLALFGWGAVRNKIEKNLTE